MLTICSLALSPTTTNNVRSFSFTPFSTSVRIRESTFFLILLSFLLAVFVFVVVVVDYEQRCGLKSEEFIVFGGGSKKRQVLFFSLCALSFFLVLLQFVTQGLSLATYRAGCRKTNNNTQIE